MRAFFFFILTLMLNVHLLGQPQKDSLPVQKSTTKFQFISFTGGLSIPMENFRSNLSEQAAPAGIGYHFNAEVSYKIKGRMYLNGCLGTFVNPLNKKQFNDSLFLPNQETMKYGSSTKKWNNTYLMIGPSYQLISTSKINIDVRFRIGAAFIRQPSFTKTYTSYYNNNGTQISPAFGQPFIYSTNDSTVTSSAGNSFSLAYSAGGAICYNLSTKLAVRLTTDILFANPRYGGFMNPITVITTSIGFAYKIKG